jgi:hypothetical protein
VHRVNGAKSRLRKSDVSLLADMAKKSGPAHFLKSLQRGRAATTDGPKASPSNGKLALARRRMTSFHHRDRLP